jgi:hypothetical protein
MGIIEGTGQTLTKASAALMTIGIADTQQVCVDNSVANEMRCAVGATISPGSAWYA